MFTMGGEAWGGFTVAALRQGMDPGERESHDAAWGLDFGPPSAPRVPERGEHAMALNMVASLQEHFSKRPADSVADDRGLTMFHALVLSGSPALVSAALAFGPDLRARAD